MTERTRFLFRLILLAMGIALVGLILLLLGRSVEPIATVYESVLCVQGERLETPSREGWVRGRSVAGRTIERRGTVFLANCVQESGLTRPVNGSFAALSFGVGAVIVLPIWTGFTVATLRRAKSAADRSQDAVGRVTGFQPSNQYINGVQQMRAEVEVFQLGQAPYKAMSQQTYNPTQVDARPSGTWVAVQVDPQRPAVIRVQSDPPDPGLLRAAQQSAAALPT